MRVGVAIDQKPAPAIVSEVRREFFLRRVATIAIAIILLGGAILLLLSFSAKPQFDTQYALRLLSKHDPGVLTARFDDMATPNGSELFSSELLIENKSFALRDATVSLGENASEVIGSDMTYFGLRALDVGKTNRSWTCPEGTWLNVSLQETDRYLYVGAVGNWLTTLFFRDAASDWNWTDENIAAVAEAANATANASSFRSTVNSGYISQVWYFNPDERSAYEKQIADVVELANECNEVHA